MGKKADSTVEINGRKFDVASGQPIKPSSSHTKPKPILGKSMDGFVSQTPAKPPVNPRHNVPATHVHQSRKRSHTLNRASVHKPSRVNRSSGVLSSSATSPGSVDPKRAHRAQTVTRSTAITKFGGSQLQPTPQPNPRSDQPSRASMAQAEPTLQLPYSRKEQLLSEAVAKASHEPEASPKKRRSLGKLFSNSRQTSILATTLAILLLVGYVTYLNVPRIALRVAASKAGFAAQMPGYNPNGFSFSGPIAYSPGQITLEYSSNTDGRNYTITEKETNWDSQSLLDSYVEQETDFYSTYQERGLIVYVFDGSNATWVNGGIWYTLSGNSNLTSEQLLKIASSL